MTTMKRKSAVRLLLTDDSGAREETERHDTESFNGDAGIHGIYDGVRQADSGMETRGISVTARAIRTVYYNQE